MPDYPRAIAARKMFEHYVPTELRRYNGADRVWHVTGHGGEVSTVYLRSVSDPDVPRGLTLDWAWLDEAAYIDEEAWDNIRPTLAVKSGDMWATTTPRGRNWVWRYAVQRPESEIDLLIHAASRDNPEFPASEWAAVKKRYGTDSARFRQEFRGLFEAFQGMAFPQFSRHTHGAQVGANPWPSYCGWDFGWTAPTVCVWMQVSPDEQVILRGCRAWTETERFLILAQVQRQVPPAECHYIDPAGGYGARDVGDPGWLNDMRRERGWKVSYTRRVRESQRLNLIRQWLHQERIDIDMNGEGADLLVEAFETAELDANPERDILADKHPQTDIIDAIGYVFAGRFGRQPITISVH